MPRNTIKCARKALRLLLKDCSYIKTITFDNGSEFSDVKGMLKLLRRHTPGAMIYYAHPYSSWERGSNENNHRLIRRFAPKGSRLSLVPHRELAEGVAFINRLPRKIFDGQSALERWHAALQKVT